MAIQATRSPSLRSREPHRAATVAASAGSTSHRCACSKGTFVRHAYVALATTAAVTTTHTTARCFTERCHRLSDPSA